MNNETGRFVDQKDFDNLLVKSSEGEREAIKKKHTMFTLGEVIMVKEQPFLLQCVSDDCLILIPKVKADVMNKRK